MIVNSDALAVPCPQCNAATGEPCRAGQRTYRDGRVHTVRNADWQAGPGHLSDGPAADEPKMLQPDPDRPGTYTNP